MKEHRVRTLTVTTPTNIDSSEQVPVCGVELLHVDLEVELRPACPDFAHLLDDVKAATPTPPCSICNSRSWGRNSNNDSDKKGTRSGCSVSHQSKRPTLTWTFYPEPLGASASPLLHLLAGDLDRDSWPDILAAVQLACKCGADAVGVDARDASGQTPLLLGGRRLLCAGRWREAARLCSVLLSAGADPNAVNAEGRSLLSYAVSALDDAIETARLLVNYGATVWTSGSADDDEGTDAVNVGVVRVGVGVTSTPVFTWFLRAVIRRRQLDDHCLQTLSLLSRAMSERPRLMHSIVMRTMFNHSRCYRVLGPVFLQIKTLMAAHWSAPQELRNLCRQTIRRALGPGVLGAMCHQHSLHYRREDELQIIATLGLPRSLKEYLLLYS